LTANEVDQELAELVVAHSAEPADLMAETRQPDREVGLGPGRVTGVRGREPQWSLLDRGEEHHRLAERHNVHRRGSLSPADGMIPRFGESHPVRTVDSYRGLQVHVFDAEEEVPPWVRSDVEQGRAVMAKGEFKTTAALAHILDRYIDEMLQTGGAAGM